MNRKHRILIALLTVLVLAVSACRATTPTPAPATPVPATAPAQPTTPPQPTAPPPEGPVTVEVWFHSGRGDERDALMKIVQGWKDPNIQLNLVELPEGDYNQQVQAAAVAGQLPCLLDFDGPYVYNYVWGGYLIPLDDYFTKEELADFLPSIIAQGTYQDGRLYSLGQFDSGLAIWARKSYLEKAGVRIPTIEKPWTGEEFNAALEALKALPETEYAIDLKMNYAPSAPSEWLTYGFSPVVQSFGGDLIDRKTYETAEGVLNGPQAVAAMQMIQSWFQKGYADPRAATDDCFTSGRCALAWVGHWTANDHIQAVGDDLLLLPMPDFGTGPKTGMGSWNWGITSACKHPEAAAKVLKFILEPENIKIMTDANGAIPARISVFEKDERFAPGGLLHTFVAQLQAGWGVPRPITAAYPTITAAFSTAFRNIADGADVQTELDKAVDKIEADLKANNYYR